MKLGFKMKLHPGMAEEYKRRHDALWPEMKDMIHQYGGSDYSIFLDEENLHPVCRTPGGGPAALGRKLPHGNLPQMVGLYGRYYGGKPR